MNIPTVGACTKRLLPGMGCIEIILQYYCNNVILTIAIDYWVTRKYCNIYWMNVKYCNNDWWFRNTANIYCILIY